MQIETLWKRRYELRKMTIEPETRDRFTIPVRGKGSEDKLVSLHFFPSTKEKTTFDPTYPSILFAGLFGPGRAC